MGSCVMLPDNELASLQALNGTLVQVLITHSQPTEAIETTLTALDGTLV